MLILVIIFGLIVGSFYNVLVSRLNQKRGIIAGRSQCPKCNTRLKWFDLVPVLSFTFLKGHCRYCHKKISFLYPIIELATAILFALFFLKRGLPLDVFVAYDLLLLLVFIPILFFDYVHYIIPDKLVIPMIFLSVVFILFFKKTEFLSLLTSGLLLGGFFAILYIVSSGKWVGLGDAKLLLLIGLAFGYPVSFLITIFSVWTAALYGLALIALKRASLKSALPFGLFLSIFSLIFILFKNETQILRYLLY